MQSTEGRANIASALFAYDRPRFRTSTLFALLVVAASCKKSTPASTDAGASASSSATAPAAASAAGTAAPSARPATIGSFETVRQQTLAGVTRPPLTPPADALSAPHGVHWQLVQNGQEPPLSDEDSLTADMVVWQPDGTEAVSTFKRDVASSIKLTSVSEEFRSLLKRLKAPAVANYWIPKAAHQGWRPESWPDSDVILQVHVYSAVRSTEPQGIRSTKPAASGPPADATVAANGLHFKTLERGGERPLESSRPLMLVWTGWVIEGLSVRRVNQTERTETTLEKVPGALAPVVKDMKVGETRRVWVPKAKAASVSPLAKDKELVVDVLVQQTP